jgi:cell division protein FtsL
MAMGNESVRRGRAQRKGGSQKEYYIEGNAVRRMETIPRDAELERLRRERVEREQLEEKRRRRAARRNQERELRMSRSYVAFLTMSVIVFGVFAILYIQLQWNLTARMRTIARLESQITDLKADNDEAYKRMNTAVDLDGIRSAAMTQLGMSYVKEAQIIYYTVGEDDYMNQYGEIPEK